LDAIYSGQAGIMALLEGAEARVRRAEDFDSEYMIGREGVSYLFQGCTDIVIVKGAREDALRADFLDAWEADRALRLLLISLDAEEDRNLRAEAADCLENLLAKTTTRIFIENELYSRMLPEDADSEFLSDTKRWKLVSEMIAEIKNNQTSIGQRRGEWDKLPSNLFADEDKTRFEEHAIRSGAFRYLASADSNSRDRNLAIFDCYKALGGVPNFRAVVREWTVDFRRPGVKRLIVEEEPDETVMSVVDSHAAFEHSKSQREAISEKLRQGSLNLARKYADQLIRFQLDNGGPEFAAKSLCYLAQEAKYFHLHSVQLEWAQRAVDINPADSWTHGQAADALIQFSRLDEALVELARGEELGDAQFAATSRARILRHQGKLEEALVAFRAARETFRGQDAEQYTWSGAAETLRDMWKFEDALQEYEQGIARYPHVRALLCGRAAVLADLGRLDHAIARYDAVELQSDLVALNGKASVLKEQGRLDEAQDVIAEAIQLYPADPVARCVQAEILRLQGDLPGALQLYEFVKMNHSTIPSAYGGYAEVLRDMRRLPEAIAAYEDAVNRFADDVRLANGYANIRKVNDELPESLRLYEKNVRQFPYDLFSKSGRADLLKRTGKYDDAISAYDQILHTRPDYESARNGKAAILVVKGCYNEALSLLPSVQPSTRNDWIAWHIRGMVLLRKNEIENAVRLFEEGRRTIPFASERRYFDGALSLARLQQSNFELAAHSLVNTGGGLSNILRFHAYAGMGNVERARALYVELSERCPAQLIELREAIAGRFGIAENVTPRNDLWIFGRESEALLQDAA
jgi:tetratricopeptide (TPR) repeat protein